MALPTQADLLGFEWGIGGEVFMDLAADSSLDQGAPEWNLGGVAVYFAATATEDPAAPRAVTALRQFALLGNPSLAEADLTALRTLVLRTSAQEDADRRVTAVRALALRTFDDPAAPRRVTAVRQMVLRTNRKGGVAQVSGGYNVVMQPALPYEVAERSPVGHYMIEAPNYNWAWNDLAYAPLIVNGSSTRAAPVGYIGDASILPVTVSPADPTPPDWSSPFTIPPYPTYSFAGAWAASGWLYSKYPKGGLVPRAEVFVANPVYPQNVTTYRWGYAPNVNPTYERRECYVNNASGSSTSYGLSSSSDTGWVPADPDDPTSPRVRGVALGGISESDQSPVILGLRPPETLPSWALKLEVPRCRIWRPMVSLTTSVSGPSFSTPPTFEANPTGWTTTSGNAAIGYAPTISVARHPGRGRWRIVPGTLQGFRAEEGTFAHLCYPPTGTNVGIPVAMQELCDANIVFNSIEELADALNATGWNVNTDLLNLEGFNVLINSRANFNIATQPTTNNGNAKWGYWMCPDNNFQFGADGYGTIYRGPKISSVGASGFQTTRSADQQKRRRYWTRTLVKSIWPYDGYFSNPTPWQWQYRLMNFGVGDFSNPAGTYGIYLPPSLMIEKLDSPSAWAEAPLGYTDVEDP